MRKKTSLVLTIPLFVGSFDLQAQEPGVDAIQPLKPHIQRAKKPFYCKRGIASWYGRKFHGRHTASGEVFDFNDLTAAHPSLPLGTYVKVTNLKNGRSIVVKVNDRLPLRPMRIIDLSYAAAYRLGLHKTGLAPVEVQVLG